MAFSRSERIGTIFTRMTSLFKGGAVTEENLPVWYNVYQAFPPKYEPCFSRSKSEKQIKNIFYKEDQLRAKFHEDASIPPMNLNSPKVTHVQIFFAIHESLLQSGVNADQAYKKAMEGYKAVFDKSTVSNRKRPPTPPPTPSHTPLDNSHTETGT